MRSYRRRYIGVELRESPVPPPGLGAFLQSKLGVSPEGRFRVVKVRGNRALVEIPQATESLARKNWNREPSLKTCRTWGTLRRAKAWLYRTQGRNRLASHRDLPSDE